MIPPIETLAGHESFNQICYRWEIYIIFVVMILVTAWGTYQEAKGKKSETKHR